MMWPRGWAGTWRADDGKTVTVSFRRRRPVVTVRPSAGASPYESNELLEGGVNPIADLEAQPKLDNDGRLRLSLEAGTPGIGPRYHLHPVVGSEGGGWARPAGTEEASSITLLPNITAGLYDDFEDDLGVSWALPLEPLRWAE